MNKNHASAVFAMSEVLTLPLYYIVHSPPQAQNYGLSDRPSNLQPISGKVKIEQNLPKTSTYLLVELQLRFQNMSHI